MKKIDAAIFRETLFIALAELAFSVLMELVFVVFGSWNYTVPLGNLFGAGVAVLNFFLMGLGVQSAVVLDEKGARDKMRFSMRMRWIMIAAAVAVGVIAPCFNTVTAIVPLFFVRIAVAFRPLFAKFLDKDEPSAAGAGSSAAAPVAVSDADPADAASDGAAQPSTGADSTAVAADSDTSTDADSAAVAVDSATSNSADSITVAEYSEPSTGADTAENKPADVLGEPAGHTNNGSLTNNSAKGGESDNEQ